MEDLKEQIYQLYITEGKSQAKIAKILNLKSSLDTLYGADPLIKLGIQFPEVVKAQIILETRWLTSKIYKKNHNLFGMKESGRNWDCGTQFGHANYHCPIYDNNPISQLPGEVRSLCDYRDWQIMRFEQARKRGMKIPQTNEEYIYFLQHLPGGGAYAEDPQYPNKLRYIIAL